MRILDCLEASQLIGVIVGGGIGIVGSIIVAGLDWMKWKSDRKIKLLVNRRDRLERSTRDLREMIVHGIVEGRTNIDAITTIALRWPNSVFDAFDAMQKDENRSKENLQAHYLKISLAMNKALADLDAEIEK
jgi:hypothetical protein